MSNIEQRLTDTYRIDTSRPTPWIFSAEGNRAATKCEVWLFGRLAAQDNRIAQLEQRIAELEAQPASADEVVSMLRSTAEMNGEAFWSALRRLPVSKFVGPLRAALQEKK